MIKVVINRCHGGFGLSHEAIMLYSDAAKLNLKAVKRDSSLIEYNYYLDGIEDNDHYFSEYNLRRDDLNLVGVVEILGEKANGWAAELAVVEIPDDVNWYIAEYDGIEHIAERHRTWS